MSGTFYDNYKISGFQTFVKKKGGVEPSQRAGSRAGCRDIETSGTGLKWPRIALIPCVWQGITIAGQNICLDQFSSSPFSCFGPSQHPSLAKIKISELPGAHTPLRSGLLRGHMHHLSPPTHLHRGLGRGSSHFSL